MAIKVEETQTWSLPQKKKFRVMVLLLDDFSEIGARVRSNVCYLICLRHWMRLRADENRMFFSPPSCVRNMFWVKPSVISTMFRTRSRSCLANRNCSSAKEIYLKKYRIYLAMVILILLHGNSEQVAHVWRKIGLKKKFRFVSTLNLMRVCIDSNNWTPCSA